MNVAAVRKMTMPSPRQRALAEDTAYADRQRINGKCVCGWYMNDILFGDWKRVLGEHLQSARHTGRNRKSGPQARTLDKHAGRDWGKR